MRALRRALPGGDVELPVVLRAGELGAVQRQVRDVGDLVRAARVVDPIGPVLAVDEQPAAVAVDALGSRDRRCPSRPSDRASAARRRCSPGGTRGCPSPAGSRSPRRACETEGGEGHQQGVEDLDRLAALAQRAGQVLLEAGLSLDVHLGDDRDQIPGLRIEVLAGVLEELEVVAQRIPADLDEVVQWRRSCWSPVIGRAPCSPAMAQPN